MINWIKNFFSLGSYTAPAPPTQKPKVDNSMDEGDFHSGPHGYSQNTAFPETQSGSRIDEEAERNEGN